ncbi:MAG: pyruvate:ferredoxin (flavodoxin) oxidoreductase [Clostridia bacterium]|nr:pyruvate:ferredoxin (flavodoxin) oxidoreductase [Clostridia bacterium]
MKREIIDGNTACAKASYKLSEISFIYPITPSSPMAELCDEWASLGEKNIFGNTLSITEMQSEAGAVGALHGSSLAGSISTTFTSSQGLLLMLPNMYKLAGEMLPCVINVASRSVASHSLNIFCDHSDIMSARQTGFAMLGASNPQEAYDFAVASFLTSLKTRIPFLHFFDGFRTSHQISVVNTLEDEELKTIYPFNKLAEFKSRAISPNNPKQYGTNESGDIFFQGREKSNLAYNNLSDELENTFENLHKLGLGQHHIMEYYGSENAKYVIVSMASSTDTIKDYIDNSGDKEIGLVKINLYRPFDVKYFLNILPDTVQKIAVLDRTKEQGSLGEPLYLDVVATVQNAEKQIKVVGGRYGLGGKEFAPNMVKAVFDNLKSDSPKNNFTVGIDDDITHTSLSYEKDYHITSKSKDFLFYGIGSDGTVSSVKNLTKIIGDKNYVQAYFMYDSKKSGGLTRSFLSVSENEIIKPYLTNENDIVVCGNVSFLTKYNIAKQIKQNGKLLINSKFTETEQIDKYVLNDIKKTLAEKNAKLYSIDADGIAREHNLQGKTSSIMQTAFLKIADIINFDEAKKQTEKLVEKAYSKKGEEVVKQNINAITDAENKIVEIAVDKAWSKLSEQNITTSNNKYYDEYIKPILDLNGDEVPVSKVNLYGESPVGTSQFEKRNVSNFVPQWNAEKCIQCGKCTFVCPHSVLRAKLLDDKQLANAPKTLETKKSILNKESNFLVEVSPADCLACGLCERACPTGAIKLCEKENCFEKEEQNFEFTKDIESKIPNIPLSVLKTQFMKPYFEFSGACAGCGETPYIKLLTQLYGKELIIANATGCSSIYGGSAPTCPYTKDENGFGTAWANSLFEDNAEFGLGIKKSHESKRQNYKKFIETNYHKLDNKLKTIFEKWLNNYDNFDECQQIYLALKNVKENLQNKNDNMYQYIFNNIDCITPKSVWLVGGDGWAYDIDAGGLDHVMASGENINILVLDTELYSNTGGQASKSTPRGAVAKFCANGKSSAKKNLVLSALQYKNVYVAEVCLGANMNQTIKAFDEAQKFDGVSIVVAYCPCINHGIDMSKNIEHELEAVKCGYWHLFRYNPALKEQNKNPMTIDSAVPTENFEDYLLKERRYINSLSKTKNKVVFAKAKQDKDDFYNILLNIKNEFKE